VTWTWSCAPPSMSTTSTATDASRCWVMVDEFQSPASVPEIFPDAKEHIVGGTLTQTDGLIFGVVGRDANGQNTDVFCVRLRRPGGAALTPQPPKKAAVEPREIVHPGGHEHAGNPRTCRVVPQRRVAPFAHGSRQPRLSVESMPWHIVDSTMSTRLSC
jgi:hypothetical protein